MRQSVGVFLNRAKFGAVSFTGQGVEAPYPDRECVTFPEKLATKGFQLLFFEGS